MYIPLSKLLGQALRQCSQTVLRRRKSGEHLSSANSNCGSRDNERPALALRIEIQALERKNGRSAERERRNEVRLKTLLNVVVGGLEKRPQDEMCCIPDGDSQFLVWPVLLDGVKGRGDILSVVSCDREGRCLYAGTQSKGSQGSSASGFRNSRRLQNP